MYKTYYYNLLPDNNGCHEVHTEDCIYYRKSTFMVEIGSYPDCRQAIAAISLRIAPEHKKFDGCYYCCPKCHEG